jgi:thiol-disulfide isomerase/thioredoxin
MRNFLIWLILFGSILIFPYTVKSQVKVGEAIDFTLADIDGNVVNLYDELANGKTIILDFFSTSCGGCALAAPIIDSIYRQFGSGTENLLVWGIADVSSNNEAIQVFIDNTGITYPCFPTGHAEDVFNYYGITYTPQILIICDYIVSQSIPNSAIIENLNYCFPTQIKSNNFEPQIQISNNQISVTNYDADYYQINLYGLLGNLISNAIIENNQQFVFDKLKSNNLYVIEIISSSGQRYSKKIAIQ